MSVNFPWINDSNQVHGLVIYVALRSSYNRFFCIKHAQMWGCVPSGPLYGLLAPLPHPWTTRPADPGMEPEQGSCATAGSPWVASGPSRDVFWTARAVLSPRRKHNRLHLQPVFTSRPATYWLQAGITHKGHNSQLCCAYLSAPGLSRPRS